MKVNWRNAFAIKTKNQPEELDFIRNWATVILDRGLAPPAIVMLELAKPFSWLLMNISAGVQPFVAPFAGSERTERLQRFFNDRQNLEYLIRLLEEGNKSGVHK
ncbi:MAG: hypothetical protein V2G42_02125 [bacterium JZ-2024 1]